MGDRAIIHFTDGKNIGPAVYLHWGGESMRDLLDATRKRMGDRTGDVEYTTARCIGLAHEMTPGNLSLGTWNAPSGGLAAIMDQEYSHGGFGVLVVDCRDWTYKHHGGYGFGTEGERQAEGGTHDGRPR